jgi:transcriptional regulator with XRE-family HTH domain
MPVKKGFVPVDEEKVRSIFGKRLKELRKKKGYKGQMGFAFEKGLNVRRYSAWETGADIKLSNIVRLCNALEISVEEFFSEGFK